MKVRVQGDAEIQLSDRDFVAEGGEGRVYAKGITGYKVYHDPAKAIPLAKIQELSGIKNTNVIKPERPIFGGRGGLVHIGHTFRFVQDTSVLCQLFTKAFREREGFTHDKSLALLRQIQEGICDVHRAGVLLVDLNEMNFLANKDLTTAYFIDVDSYQTPHFPATAIMPSVRDWKTDLGKFSELSDWFSFAILSFQLLVGIHPFKGKHPTVKALEERMQRGISVFDASVKVPATCYSFDLIPPAYKAWYRALFVEGKRAAPPSDIHGAIVLQTIVQTIQGTDRLDIQEIAEFAQEIHRVLRLGNHTVVRSKDHVFVDRRQVQTHQGVLAFAVTPRNGHVISAHVKDEKLVLRDLITDTPLPFDLRANEMMSYEGRLYVRTGENVYQITFTEAANKQWVSASLVVNVLPHASKLYEGVVLQNLLGEPHASFFVREGSVFQTKIPELRGYKIVTAKFDRGVLMVVGGKGGKYDRFVFRFDDEFRSHDVRIVEDVQSTEINFVTLESGVCVCMDEEERLEVFSARKDSAHLKIIDDDALHGDMRLSKDVAQLCFHQGNRFYRMRMK